MPSHMPRMAALLALFITGFALAQEPSLQFGVTDTLASPMACATFEDAQLPPGEPLLFIGFNPQRWVRGRIAHKRSAACREASILVGTAYDVQLDDTTGVAGELGVSVLGADLRPESNADPLVFASDSDGSRLAFKQCTSNEGIHFFAYRDAVMTWHAYYHLPYDTLHSCLDSDFDALGRQSSAADP